MNRFPSIFYYAEIYPVENHFFLCSIGLIAREGQGQENHRL